MIDIFASLATAEFFAGIAIGAGFVIAVMAVIVWLDDDDDAFIGNGDG